MISSWENGKLGWSVADSSVSGHLGSDSQVQEVGFARRLDARLSGIYCTML